MTLPSGERRRQLRDLQNSDLAGKLILAAIPVAVVLGVIAIRSHNRHLRKKDIELEIAEMKLAMMKKKFKAAMKDDCNEDCNIEEIEI